jgi:hypothetical protein
MRLDEFLVAVQKLPQQKHLYNIPATQLTLIGVTPDYFRLSINGNEVGDVMLDRAGGEVVGLRPLDHAQHGDVVTVSAILAKS